jgi:hypothetical protein
MAKPKRAHTNTTLKLSSDYVATVKALLNMWPPPSAEKILKAEQRPKRRRSRKGRI